MLAPITNWPEGLMARLDPNGTTFDPVATNSMRRAGHMHELANLAVFLLGPGSEYLTGQTIAIDGGSTWPTAATSPTCRRGPKPTGSEHAGRKGEAPHPVRGVRPPVLRRQAQAQWAVPA
jgi:hypothetical protein